MVAIGALILLIFLAMLLLPKKSTQQSQAGPFATPLAQLQQYVAPQAEPLVPVRQQSLREQALNEDAEALAGEFRRVRYEQYLADLRTAAATAFSAGTKKIAT